MPFSVEQYCGHCNHLTSLIFSFAAGHNVRTPTPHEKQRQSLNVRTIDDRDRVQAHAVGICPLCGRPNLILFETQRSTLTNIVAVVKAPESLFGGQSVIEVSRVLPTVPSMADHPSWGPTISDPFVSAQANARERRSPALTIAGCRMALEEMTKRLGATSSDNLKVRIERLRDQGVITASLADWAHHIRLLGNDAVHEIGGTQEEAAELIEFTHMLLDMCLTLPETMAAKRAKKP